MLQVDDLEPIDVAVEVCKELEFEYESTEDDDMVCAKIPGHWGYGRLVVWHDYDSQIVNFFVAFDDLKISKRRTSALLLVINQLNTGLQYGTVAYEEEDKRIQMKYAVPTDSNDYVDAEVIETIMKTLINAAKVAHYYTILVASGEFTHKTIGSASMINATVGTA